MQVVQIFLLWGIETSTKECVLMLRCNAPFVVRTSLIEIWKITYYSARGALVYIKYRHPPTQQNTQSQFKDKESNLPPMNIQSKAIGVSVYRLNGGGARAPERMSIRRDERLHTKKGEANPTARRTTE